MFDHLMQSLDDFQREVDSLSTLSSRSGQQFNAMAMMNEARAETAKKNEIISKRTTDALDKMRTGVIGFTQSALDGRNGMEKYASSINTTSDAIVKLIVPFENLRKVMGVFGSVIGYLIEAVLKQNDQFLEAYDSLADIGVAAGMSAEQLKETVLASQKNIKYLPSFMSALKKLGTNIMVLGNSTAESTSKFAKITDIAPEVYDEFRRLGVSQEKVNELQADYVVAFGTLENLRTKDAQHIRTASLSWIKETMAYTAITGITREEMLNSQKQLEDDVATQIRLASIDNANERMALTNLGTMLESKMSGYGKAIIADMTIGTALNETFAKFTGQMFPEYENFKVEFKQAARVSQEEAYRVLKKYSVAFVQQLDNKATNASDTFNNLKTKDYAEQTGAFASVFDLFRTIAKSDSLENAKDALEKTAQTGDKMLDARNKALSFENKLARVMQQFIDLVSGPITTGFQMLLEGVNWFLDALVDSKLFEWLTGNKVSPTMKLQRYSNFGTAETGKKNLEKLYNQEITVANEATNMLPDNAFKNPANRKLEELPEDESALKQILQPGFVHVDSVKEYNERVRYLKAIQKQQQDTAGRLKQISAIGKRMDEPKPVQAPSAQPLSGTTPTPVPSPQTPVKPVQTPVLNQPTPTNIPEPTPSPKQPTQTVEVKVVPPVEKPVAETPVKQIEKEKPVAETPAKPIEKEKPVTETPVKIKKPIGDGIQRVPESGEKVTIDNPKAIVPLPDGKTIPVNIMGMDTLTKSIDGLNGKVDALHSLMNKTSRTMQKDINESIDKLVKRLNAEQQVINLPEMTVDMKPLIAKMTELNTKMANMATQVEDIKSLNQQLARVI